jgi:hypothetical protein
MADVLKNIPAQQLTTGFVDLYEVPVDTTFAVGMIHVANTTASNALLWDFTLNARDVIEFGKGDVWEEGYTLQGMSGTASAITVKVSGIETDVV